MAATKARHSPAHQRYRSQVCRHERESTEWLPPLVIERDRKRSVFMRYGYPTTMGYNRRCIADRDSEKRPRSRCWPYLHSSEYQRLRSAVVRASQLRNSSVTGSGTECHMFGTRNQRASGGPRPERTDA